MAAEQALDFPFRQRIALLDFSAAGFQRFYGMLFGRSRRAAHAITTGFAAQQDNDIPGNRSSRITFARGAAPRTAPISIRFAINP